jgi:hypothetical protein
MVKTSTRLGLLGAALVLALGTAPACSKSSEPASGSTSSAAAMTAQAPSESKEAAGKTIAAPTDEATPTTSAAAGADTVVFEVTGTGNATTIDLVPAPPEERLYDVPLPWSSTVSIGSDVTQLQIVVVGSTATNPGCKITLNGAVVAEKPEGGDAHCIFDG